MPSSIATLTLNDEFYYLDPANTERLLTDGWGNPPVIKQDLPKVLAFTNFTDGNLYTDFNPSTDKLATYGLAALVAGGIAAKAGLFAKIGIFLLAAKKFLVIGVVALFAVIRKLFNRNKT